MNLRHLLARLILWAVRPEIKPEPARITMRGPKTPHGAKRRDRYLYSPNSQTWERIATALANRPGLRAYELNKITETSTSGICLSDMIASGVVRVERESTQGRPAHYYLVSQGGDPANV